MCVEGHNKSDIMKQFVVESLLNYSQIIMMKKREVNVFFENIDIKTNYFITHMQTNQQSCLLLKA